MSNVLRQGILFEDKDAKPFSLSVLPVLNLQMRMNAPVYGPALLLLLAACGGGGGGGGSAAAPNDGGSGLELPPANGGKFYNTVVFVSKGDGSEAIDAGLAESGIPRPSNGDRNVVIERIVKQHPPDLATSGTGNKALVLHVGAGDQKGQGGREVTNLFLAYPGAYKYIGIVGAADNIMSYADARRGVEVDLSAMKQLASQLRANNAGDSIQSISQSRKRESWAQGDALENVNHVVGSAHPDILAGDGENNVLRSGAGNDRLKGGVGKDRLNGGDGNDYLEGGKDADVIDGGSGVDTASYASSSSGVTVDLSDGTPESGGDAQGDTLTGIENLIGSLHDDRLTGNHGANRLDGGFGDDALIGGAGNDELDGGAGTDKLIGGTGNDRLDGGAGDDELSGGTGNDRLFGKTGDDTLRGDDGNDELYGYSGADKLHGGNGADDLRGGGYGDDLLDGGKGADYMDGERGNDEMNGGSGNDRIFGGSGNDEINGGDGNDRLHGHSGNDSIYGDLGDDELVGHDGDDKLSGGNGADALRGGIGFDVVDYSDSDSGVKIDLSAGTVSGGHADGDRFSDVEGIVGSKFDDLLTGDAGDNEIYGGAGNDVINGGGGADHIFGDTGADTFVFELQDINTDSLPTYIYKFQAGIDKICVAQKNGDEVVVTPTVYGEHTALRLGSNNEKNGCHCGYYS